MSYLYWILIIGTYIFSTHLIAQYLGTKRKIGYGKSVLWSILFSPVIGLIITKSSQKIDEG